jgi:hypothetical protein
MMNFVRAVAKSILCLLLMALTSLPVHAGGWDVYCFGVNTKAFKEADWKMVVLGAATSLAVHTGGHYAYAGLSGMSVRQDWLSEIISFADSNPKQIREFMQAGFVAQHAVGLLLTTIPATRHTDFTRGYVAFAWFETATYPLHWASDGDLYWSDVYGGNRDMEYFVFMVIATHNLLRVSWKKE